MSVRTPLRYPGGKHRALAQIFKQFPDHFASFREPFVGGGSVFIAARQAFPRVPVWINDLSPDVASFWQVAQSQLGALVREVRAVRDTASDGRGLYQHWRDLEPRDTFERALRFFVLNRITFSGTTDSGGYSPAAFETRFTHSSIERLGKLEAVMDGVRVTNRDYRALLEPDEPDTLVFLDPPYWSATKSKLYGVNGHLHTGFDHAAFALELRKSAHHWLVTYDDSAPVRKLFGFAHLEPWALQYGMNNYRQDSAAIGQELFIRNYRLER